MSDDAPVRKPLEDSSSAVARKLPAAQLTRMSSRPNRATVSRTARSQSSYLRTSPCAGTARGASLAMGDRFAGAARHEHLLQAAVGIGRGSWPHRWP